MNTEFSIKDFLSKSEINNKIKEFSTNASNSLMILVNFEEICHILNYLCNQQKLKFQMLVNITAVDYLKRDKRFDVIYSLLSMKINKRIYVKVCVNEDNFIPTVYEIFKSASWYEREIWDLFGIPFKNHPDMRRILTDYDFVGHPFRKDFPLFGNVELRYDDDAKKILYESVVLEQEFRDFDFKNIPKSAEQHILYGDEKASKSS